MPRGVKKLTKAEEFALQIEEKEKEIAELKLKKEAAELEDMIKAYGDVLAVIRESGLTNAQAKKAIRDAAAAKKKASGGKKRGAGNRKTAAKKPGPKSAKAAEEEKASKSETPAEQKTEPEKAE